MARLSDRYTREQPEERMRSFMERRLLRRVGHENQSTNDESEIPSVSSTGYGWWNAIAVLEILGGAIGLVVGTLYPLLNSAFNASPAIVALDILFLLSIIAGVYLWRNREFGLHLSLFLFVLQIPQFALGASPSSSSPEYRLHQCFISLHGEWESNLRLFWALEESSLSNLPTNRS